MWMMNGKEKAAFPKPSSLTQGNLSRLREWAVSGRPAALPQKKRKAAKPAGQCRPSPEAASGRG